jgi:hypothetical protein
MASTSACGSFHPFLEMEPINGFAFAASLSNPLVAVQQKRNR